MKAHSMTENESNPEPATGQPQSRRSTLTGSQGPRMVKSEDLLRGARELFILHDGQTYRLMETRNGKLILQK